MAAERDKENNVVRILGLRWVMCVNSSETAEKKTKQYRQNKTSVVICLEPGADLHMAQLMPLPLTVSCFSKIQIGFTFLVPVYPGCHGKEAVK